MRISYLFGIIIFLFSCKEAPIVLPPPPEEEIPVVVEVDSAPPIIKWIFCYSGYIRYGWLDYKN